jgi:hypothetical protein
MQEKKHKQRIAEYQGYFVIFVKKKNAVPVCLKSVLLICPRIRKSDLRIQIREVN